MTHSHPDSNLQLFTRGLPVTAGNTGSYTGAVAPAAAVIGGLTPTLQHAHASHGHSTGCSHSSWLPQMHTSHTSLNDLIMLEQPSNGSMMAPLSPQGLQPPVLLGGGASQAWQPVSSATQAGNSMSVSISASLPAALDYSYYSSSAGLEDTAASAGALLEPLELLQEDKAAGSLLPAAWQMQLQAQNARSDAMLLAEMRAATASMRVSQASYEGVTTEMTSFKSGYNNNDVALSSPSSSIMRLAAASNNTPAAAGLTPAVAASSLPLQDDCLLQQLQAAVDGRAVLPPVASSLGGTAAAAAAQGFDDAGAYAGRSDGSLRPASAIELQIRLLERKVLALCSARAAASGAGAGSTF